MQIKVHEKSIVYGPVVLFLKRTPEKADISAVEALIAYAKAVGKQELRDELNTHKRAIQAALQ